MGTQQDISVRLSAFLARSRATGPGCRAALWLQGNLEQPDKGITPTVPPHCRQLFLVDYLFRHIVAIGHAIEGITITGGEPFDQYAAVLHLTQRIKAETSLSVMLFTNLTLAEVYDQQRGYAPLLATIDVLVTKPSPDHPTDQHPLPLAHQSLYIGRTSGCPRCRGDHYP